MRLFLYGVFLLLTLNACHTSSRNDLVQESTHEDEVFFAPQPPQPKLDPASPPIPSAMKTRVSVHLSHTLPLRDALVDLAAQTKVNLGLGKDVSGNITLVMRNQPFIEIIENVCTLASLRYHIEGETIFIERDTPFAKNYSVSFLNMQRQSQNRMSVSTDLASSVLGTASTRDNGTNHTISGTTTTNFWDELRKNLEQLLMTSRSYGPSSSYFTLHQQAGLITIIATERDHQLVATYLQHLQDAVTAQVLIEAKVIEVSLYDEFRSGVDWNSLYKNLSLQEQFGLVGKIASAAPLDMLSPEQLHKFEATRHNMASFHLQTHQLQTALNFLQRYGTIRTLSSPRLTVINNQSAVLKVAESDVYFKLKYNKYVRSKEEGGDQIFVSSDVQTVPIGLILVVHPSIHLETGKITLALRPTITRIGRQVSDPAVEIVSGNKVISTVPVVEVREIDSILHMGDGEVIVLGGLMQECTDDDSTGLPGLRRLPLVSQFFRGDHKKSRVIELVIFIKATILRPETLSRLITQSRTQVKAVSKIGTSYEQK